MQELTSIETLSPEALTAIQALVRAKSQWRNIYRNVTLQNTIFEPPHLMGMF
jgi:hypothetical protein